MTRSLGTRRRRHFPGRSGLCPASPAARCGLLPAPSAAVPPHTAGLRGSRGRSLSRARLHLRGLKLFKVPQGSFEADFASLTAVPRRRAAAAAAGGGAAVSLRCPLKSRPRCPQRPSAAVQAQRPAPAATWRPEGGSRSQWGANPRPGPAPPPPIAAREPLPGEQERPGQPERAGGAAGNTCSQWERGAAGSGG